MNRLRALVLTLTAAVPLSAQSAEITRIASSFEDTRPFGMFIDVGFQHTQRKLLITRESHEEVNGTRTVVDRKELRYTGIDTRLNLDLHIGIWKDVEFHYGLPIVFQRNEYYGFASGTDASNSTLTPGPNNCLNARGELVSPTCTSTGAGSTAYWPNNTAAPPTSYRNGLGNMRFGLAWAPFNQQKDDTKPTWIVGLDYEAPTAQGIDPSVITTPSARGGVGDRVHRYMFYTTFSRRIGIVDPYFQTAVTLNYRGPGWYSNCDHPEVPSMGRAENCNDTEWGRSRTGIEVPIVARMIFGAEFNAYEMAEKHQRVALDLRAISEYVGPGRYYNELTTLTQKFMATQDYLKFGGRLGINAYASDYIRLQATAALLYNTPHLLSNEAIGRDLNNDGQINVSTNPREVNPNFDYRSDVVSRHFRASEIWDFQLNVTASLNF
jgi:hypothetical protein